MQICERDPLLFGEVGFLRARQTRRLGQMLDICEVGGLVGRLEGRRDDRPAGGAEERDGGAHPGRRRRAGSGAPSRDHGGRGELADLAQRGGAVRARDRRQGTRPRPTELAQHQSDREQAGACHQHERDQRDPAAAGGAAEPDAPSHRLGERPPRTVAAAQVFDPHLRRRFPGPSVRRVSTDEQHPFGRRAESEAQPGAGDP